MVARIDFRPSIRIELGSVNKTVSAAVLRQRLECCVVVQRIQGCVGGIA